MTGTVTEMRLARLARELRRSGWAPMPVAEHEVAEVRRWLREQAGLTAAFVDGDFDIWVLEGHWGSAEAAHWRKFGHARAEDAETSPEAHGIGRIGRNGKDED